MYSVRCGEWDTKSEAEPKPHQERRVALVTVHPSYKRDKYYSNNVAVLHLAGEFALDDHVSPICLPDEGLGAVGYDWGNCWATGWGKEDYSGSNSALHFYGMRIKEMHNF